jgi:hypothetical protein
VADSPHDHRYIAPYVLTGFEKRIGTYTGKSALQEATELRAIAKALMQHIRALEQEEGAPAK